MFLSIILGVAFNLFDHWPYLIPYVAAEAARLGFGTPEYIEAVKTSPFLMLYIGIIGPILEEFFYRGILFNQCELELGVKRACFFSALIWAVSHGWWGSFLYVFPMGIIISYFYHKTRNILIPILIHGMNNFYSVITEYKINKRILETLFHTSLDDLGLMKANIVIGLIILLASVTIFYFIVQLQKK
jgi:membrane protease YdiL (CAAX protease family)